MAHIIGAVWRLCRLVRREKVHIVHANGSRCMFYAGVAGWLARRPVVWHVRVGASDGWWDRFLGILAARIIVNSRAVGERFATGGVANKVRLVYNGEPMERHAQLAPAVAVGYRREFDAESGHLLAMVARLTEEKDFETYLRAGAELNREGVEARYLVVGIDPDPHQTRLRRLQELAVDLGMADRLIFTGNRGDIAALMGCLDLLVHCAHIEGFGRVLVEAMAAAVPVVATAVGGIPEVVEDGRTGILVGEGDHMAVAAAVGELLRDPDRRRRMGAAGRRRVEERFSLESHVDRIVEVYEEFAPR